MQIGGYLDPPKGPTIKGPRLSDLSAQTASYGANIGRGYGMFSVQGNVFWVEGGGLREVVKRNRRAARAAVEGRLQKHLNILRRLRLVCTMAKLMALNVYGWVMS